MCIIDGMECVLYPLMEGVLIRFIMLDIGRIFPRKLDQFPIH